MIKENFHPITLKSYRVLVFIPQAAVTPQAALLGIIARLLKDNGDDVTIVNCDHFFKFCPAMRCHGITPYSSEEEKSSICSKCLPASKDLLSHYQLDQTITLGQKESIELGAKCDLILSEYSNSGKSWENFSYDNFTFGGIASYDASLALKSLILDEDSISTKETLLSHIRDTMMSYLAIDKISRKLKPEIIVYYNDYAIMHAAAKAAIKHGAKPSIIAHASHRNVDFRKINIFPGNTLSVETVHRERWRIWRELPLTQSIISEIGADIIQRLRGEGTHVFSNGRSLESSNISIKSSVLTFTNRPLLVAFTSSPDEVFAGFRMAKALGVPIPPQKYTFGKNYKDFQKEWLNEIADYCHKKNYNLVIRVHPREGKNRDGFESTHYINFKKVLNNLPGSPTVISPDDPVSSYDLAEMADLILTGWTSMAYEMARVAIPVLAAAENVSMAPTDCFHPFFLNKSQYFKQLENFLITSSSIETVTYAFRWWHLCCFGGSLDISDLVFTPGFSGHPDYHYPNEAQNIRNAIVKDGHSFELNLERLKEEGKHNSHVLEKKVILNELNEIINTLCFGPTTNNDKPTEFRLITSEKLDSYQPEHSHIIARDGRRVVYLNDATNVTLYSPMLNRLIQLVTNLN